MHIKQSYKLYPLSEATFFEGQVLSYMSDKDIAVFSVTATSLLLKETSEQRLMDIPVIPLLARVGCIIWQELLDESSLFNLL